MWIIFTILAAFLQNIRNSLQRSLGSKTDVILITWSRFLFAIPGILLVISYFSFFHKDLLFNFEIRFLGFCFLAGIFQILGNVALVHLLKMRNFVVGITYMKTEVLQTAILGALLFSESLDFAAVIMVLVAFIGLIFLSPFSKLENIKKLFNELFHKTALVGILCGLFFSFCALFLKRQCCFLEQIIKF